MPQIYIQVISSNKILGKFTSLLVFLCFIILCMVSMATSADDLSAVRNCIKVTPVVGGDEVLTKEERIKRMDQAFDESLTKFEECLVTAPTLSGSAGGVLSGGGSQNQQAGQQEGQQGNEHASSATPVKSRGISGNETPKLQPPVVTGDTSPQGTLLGSGTPIRLQQNKPLQNGKLPDDIPEVDNDNAFAQQLRRAAESEQDPVRQVRLWNEYRRYKGLPEKDLPEDSSSN